MNRINEDKSRQDNAGNNQYQLILSKKELSQLKYQHQLLVQVHQQTLQQLAEANHKYEQQKQLNQLLTSNLKQLSENNPSGNSEIKLKIQGEFLSQRIIELEAELMKYRSGVNQSVDRRVKKIVEEINTDKDLQIQKVRDIQRRKSRLLQNNPISLDHEDNEQVNHNHNYYNIQYHNNNYQSDLPVKNFTKPKTKGFTTLLDEQSKRKSNYFQNPQEQNSACEPYEIKFNRPYHNNKNEIQEVESPKLMPNFMNNSPSTFICQKCKALVKQLEAKDKDFYLLEENFKNLSDEYSNLIDHFEELKERNDLLIDQLNNQNSPKNSGYHTQTEHGNFQKNDNRKLQDLTNLINGLSVKNRKVTNDSKKSRVCPSNSRLSQQTSKLDCSNFTIKQGVNRYQNSLF